MNCGAVFLPILSLTFLSAFSDPLLSISEPDFSLRAFRATRRKGKERKDKRAEVEGPWRNIWQEEYEKSYCFRIAPSEHMPCKTDRCHAQLLRLWKLKKKWVMRFCCCFHSCRSHLLHHVTQREMLQRRAPCSQEWRWRSQVIFEDWVDLHRPLNFGNKIKCSYVQPLKVILLTSIRNVMVSQTAWR